MRKLCSVRQSPIIFSAILVRVRHGAKLVGASTSEPHSQELNSKSVTRDIYRYIYISIVGWSPSFEPAPGAAPAGLVKSRNSDAPPRIGPFSPHVSPAKYMTSGRIEFPKLTHFSSAKYNTSGRIGFLYTFSMHAQTSNERATSTESAKLLRGEP